MRSRLTAVTLRHPVVAYALLTYAITWILVLPLVLNGLGITHLTLPAGWHALGALGPLVAAFAIAGVTQGRPGTATLLRSIGRGVWARLLVGGGYWHAAAHAGAGDRLRRRLGPAVAEFQLRHLPPPLRQASGWLTVY